MATAALFVTAVMGATACGAESTAQTTSPVSASPPAAANESLPGTEDVGLIAFTKGASGDACDSEGIFCARLDGSGLRRLADKGARHPAWSPDGTKIAFTMAAAVGTDIYVVNVDGSGRQRIVAGEADPWSRIAWSPDGNQIVFVHGHDGSTLMVANVGDGATRELTTFSKNRRDGCPAWSPDGKIYFARTYGPMSKICSVNPDGSRLAVVRDRTWSTFSLSPDGKWLAIQERSGELVRVAGDGRGDEVVLVEDPDRMGLKGFTPSSSWSPDGKQIMIGSYEAPWQYQAWLHRVKADGSDQLVGPDVGLAFDPAWQPRLAGSHW